MNEADDWTCMACSSGEEKDQRTKLIQNNQKKKLEKAEQELMNKAKKEQQKLVQIRIYV